MKTKILLIAFIFFISCSESSDTVDPIQLCNFKAEVTKVREEMETDTGRIYRTITSKIVLLEKNGISKEAAYDLKEIYDRGVEVDLEIRDPGNLTIRTTSTYKVTITFN